jgi:CheY-like chemotaxis protein
VVQERDGRLAEEARKRGDDEALRIFKESQRQAEELRSLETIKAPAQPAKAPTPVPVAQPKAAVSVADRQPLPDEVEAMIRKVAAAEVKRRQEITHDDSTPPVSHGSHTEDLRIYREFLEQAWSNGAPGEEGFRQIGQLRTALLVLKEEHNAIEHDVRINSYIMACQNAVSSPSCSTQGLLDLRRIYGITEEEHVKLEARVPGIAPRARKRPMVLIIDDDARLLEILAQVIEDAGFESIALPTSDEAYALLRKLRPDLILCDINLETSTMGGFTFYERVQERQDLQDVPFIFLTGLTDEVLVRTGKELGVDDYLTKPISEATLVSTLRGKLKRFKQLRNAFPRTAAA